MDHFAGIDVSLEQSSVCVVDATGRIVREAKVASEPEALITFLRGLNLPLVRIGLETGPLSQWLQTALVKAGFEAVLLETRHVKAALSAMIVKTDRKDARGIAQLLRMGWPAGPLQVGARLKTELGLAHNETRSWHGWHRHVPGHAGLRPDGRGAPPSQPMAAPKNKDQGSPSHALIRWSVQEIRRVAMRLAQRRIRRAVLRQVPE